MCLALQGDIINRIEYNVEMAAVHVDVARKDVRVAAPYHKKNTRVIFLNG